MRLTLFESTAIGAVPGRTRRFRAALLLSAALGVPARPASAQPAPDAATEDPGPVAGNLEPSAIRRQIEKLRAAIEDLSGGISLSAFFDVRAANRRNDPGIVSMGDFEVDLTGEIGKSVQVGAAVVLNDEGASLAVAFVDFHLFGGLIAPRGRLPVEKGFHVQLGRFDVPFGSDWQHFAAKDRTELTAPLTTESIMDGGYNDVGLRVLGNTGSFIYSAFVLRGDGPGRLYGGRLGFTPFDNPYRIRPRTRAFEAGVSLLHDVDRRGVAQETSFALDSEIQVGPCRLRGEYLRKDARPTGGRSARVVRRGWHVTAVFDAGELAGVPTTPYARYDTVTGDQSPEAVSLRERAEPAAVDGRRIERLTAGLKVRLLDLASLKLECQRILAAPVEVRERPGFGRDSWFAQVVVVF